MHTVAPLPILHSQSCPNRRSASASGLVTVLMQRSSLFSWFDDTAVILAAPTHGSDFCYDNRVSDDEWLLFQKFRTCW